MRGVTSTSVVATAALPSFTGSQKKKAVNMVLLESYIKMRKGLSKELP